MVFQEMFGKYINGYNMNRRYMSRNRPEWRDETMNINYRKKTSGIIIVLTY